MTAVPPCAFSEKPAVLYEDEDILALNKPPGLRVVPDRWDSMKPNVITWLNTEGNPLASRCPHYYVVHRLDKDTSGVVLFAKNAAAHRALSLAFNDRRVRKTYDAIVEGEMEAEMGIIDRPLASHPRKKGWMMVDPAGKPSRTEFHLLARARGFSRVRLFPHTGRTHQIRVHMQALGHPLAVDPLYGCRSALYWSDVAGLNRRPEEKPLLDRLSLHAAELSVAHPSTRQHLVITAPPAADLCRAWEVLQTDL